MGGVRRIPSVLSAATAQATNAVLSTTVSTAMSTRVGSVMLVRLAAFEWVDDSVERREYCVAA